MTLALLILGTVAMLALMCEIVAQLMPAPRPRRDWTEADAYDLARIRSERELADLRNRGAL